MIEDIIEKSYGLDRYNALNAMQKIELLEYYLSDRCNRRYYAKRWDLEYLERYNMGFYEYLILRLKTLKTCNDDIREIKKELEKLWKRFPGRALW